MTPASELFIASVIFGLVFGCGIVVMAAMMIGY